MIKLSSSQSSVLSGFCNDIAKGLFLGVVINQLFTNGSLDEKLLFLSFGLIIIGIFLYLALLFSK